MAATESSATRNAVTAGITPAAAAVGQLEINSEGLLAGMTSVSQSSSTTPAATIGSIASSSLPSTSPISTSMPSIRTVNSGGNVVTIPTPAPRGVSGLIFLDDHRILSACADAVFVWNFYGNGSSTHDTSITSTSSSTTATSKATKAATRSSPAKAKTAAHKPTPTKRHTTDNIPYVYHCRNLNSTVIQPSDNLSTFDLIQNKQNKA
jgi:cell division septation protein DedD